MAARRAHRQPAGDPRDPQSTSPIDPLGTTKPVAPVKLGPEKYKIPYEKEVKKKEKRPKQIKQKIASD